MKIPNEAVEAAAKAAALADNFTELDWNMVPRRYTQRYYDLAQAGLEAAAPHMLAGPAMTAAPLRITQELLDTQRTKGWTDWHPEDYCHKCFETNVSWYVDTQPWTNVMRGGDADGWGKWQEIICIPCFTELADKHYGAKQAWTIARDRSSYHLRRVAP